MPEKTKVENVPVNTEEMDIIVEGLNGLQAEVKKLVVAAEKKKREDMAKVGRAVILKIEDIKSKFLHS